MQIRYIDRKTKRQKIEKVYGSRALFLLYGNSLFSRLASFFLLPLLSRFPFFSQVYGFFQKRKASAKKIAPFIEEYGIEKKEFLDQEFSSFNDFFIRKLKPECRPIDPDPSHLAAPADGRYLVYPEIQLFQVKGQQFDLDQFLQDPSLACRYRQGSMIIARLCPSDYHRFHFPCDAIPSPFHLLNGSLFSVNPIALAKRGSIFSENKRVITELASEEFGTIGYVEIGATSVGSIRQLYTPGKSVKKGEEKGYFEFGGSCIVLLFEKNRILFDEDLKSATQEGLETLILFGESIGRAARFPIYRS